MFVEKLKEEVYDVILQERVLVLVSMDVDALCSCKILQWLFKCDSIQYTLVPVSGKEDLARAYLEHADQIKHIFLINCGGNINLLEMLEPDEDIRFYIADSHRPLHLDNIYNQDQVKILMKEGETLEVPDFDDIYAESEDDDDSHDDDDDDSEPSSKRQKTDEGENSLSARAKKKQWERKRQDILYRYHEYAFYGTSSAVVMYELAWKLSKDSNDLLWLAAIGLTDQYLNERVDSEKYVSDAETLHEHVMRHNHGTDENGVSINCMKIAFDAELRLALYRHWSLFDSICHSNYTACRFRVWTMKGKKKLHEFLADMGIPLAQSRETFSSMDVELRNNLKEWISTSAEKFGMDEITYGSFHVQYGFRNKLCASDCMYAVNAILEMPDENSKSDKFLQALDSLSRSNTKLLLDGIEMAKTQLTALVNQVRSLIDMHQVVCGGPFLYAFLREGTPDLKMFSKPIVLGALARYVLNAYVGMSKNKRAAALPFVLATPLDTDKGTCLVTGVPPIADESKKNFLGRAFEMAADKTKARSQHDSFDSAVIEIKSEDREKFFDALSALLL
ncbi:cell division control protein 45 homolog [Exaiptasia diaphana]|uniref:Cell division control protein 45 homolog n=1 Tax=Exaiptasia diaphana TaxID=2652724 RepID=A0A913Y4C0_EXADI|nr:cell division control protein 45 homolog [Exaiptasia diaphana]KXJ28983.1 Cell division control protein 45-like [Exaiptasia diaphana]